ncbi:MAG: hypothetical protein JWM91_573 [Rhodospirillales bacterium]|nr:hypothetical protein [Rhodospirillales bacterium]
MASNLITVSASATLANGVGPHMNVVVDGKTIGSATVGTSLATYSFNATLSPNAAHNIQVVYDNDSVINGQDRNLLLRSISVDGQSFSANSSYEVYSAQGQGNLAGDGNMYWNGSAKFSLPASVFSASGTPAPGPAPSPAPTPSGPGFYVSTSGGDGADGSSAHPFATLTRAVLAMEASGTHTSFIENCVYRLNASVTLGSRDSGMTVQAAPGATPILDGGGSLSTLVRLDGASGVTLQGITFQNTAGRAALVMNGANGNKIIANHFTHTGEGMLLTGGSSNNIVSGNELDSSSTSAIEAQNGSNGNSFDSNHINGTGAIGTAGGGFFLHGANNNSITHNLVENTQGVGIGVENWDANTINVGNVITNNIAKNTNLNPASIDGGAIYELGRSHVDSQSIISNNYVSESSAIVNDHLVGIYLDDLTSGVQITNNIVTDFATHAVQIHGGSNVTVKNNILDLGASSGLQWGKGSAILFQSENGFAMTNISVSRNIITSTSPTPLSYSNLGAGTPAITGNFYMDLLGGHFQTSGDALPESNAVYGNARFNNQAAGDYSLGANSDANSVGYVSINQRAMRLHPANAQWPMA